MSRHEQAMPLSDPLSRTDVASELSPSGPYRAVKQLGLVLLCTAWILLGLFGHDPWKPDDATAFGTAYDMLRHGDWVVPHLASGTTEDLFSVTTGNGLVAVGANGKIVQSSDGGTWNAATSPTSQNLFAVAFANGVIHLRRRWLRMNQGADGIEEDGPHGRA